MSGASDREKSSPGADELLEESCALPATGDALKKFMGPKQNNAVIAPSARAWPRSEGAASPSASAPLPGAEPVDRNAVAQLRELDESGRANVFLELVTLFNESTPQLLSEACVALDNPMTLRMIAHTLKGSCSNFGAHPMEALCLELEQLGPHGTSRSAREVIDDIEREFFNVRAALAHYAAQV